MSIDHRCGRGRSRRLSHPVPPVYTEAVGLWWRRGVSAVVLSVFAGLPVSALVCAIDCAAEARATPVNVGHHASPATCHEVSEAFVAIEETSHHDCEHTDLAVAAFLTTVRADTTVLSVKHAIVATRQATLAPAAGCAQLRSGAPPGAAPPVRTPLVLRI